MYSTILEVFFVAGHGRPFPEWFLVSVSSTCRQVSHHFDIPGRHDGIGPHTWSCVLSHNIGTRMEQGTERMALDVKCFSSNLYGYPIRKA